MNKLILVPLISTLSLALVSCASSNDYLIEYNKQAAIKKSKQAALKAEMLAKIDAGGSPWIYIGHSVDDAKIYIDGRSIQGTSGGSIPLMYRGGNLEFSSKGVKVFWKAIEEDGSYTQIQSYVYCTNKAIKNIGVTEYSARHEFLSDVSVDDYVSVIGSDTVAEQVANFACAIDG